MNLKLLFAFLLGCVLTLAVVWGFSSFSKVNLVLPGGLESFKPDSKPLLAYTYTNLKVRKPTISQINFDAPPASHSGKGIWTINFSSDGKRVSGVVNLPEGISTQSAISKNPVIIMAHGFASYDEYYPGFGTEHVAKVLAANGFVTIAPDFLGYGTSDKPSLDVFEDRFQNYTTLIDLISSVCNAQSIDPGLNLSTNNYELITNNCRIGLWGHSNGGQISLSVLEITGAKIPTVLWNPVSKPFPYSILYYTDDFDDQGKELRKVLANFEKNYDVEQYSIPNFLDWINAPILLQQGSADQSVPQKWSDELSQRLKSKAKDVEYKVYAGADHNMTPKWNEATGDLVRFYKSRLN